jgi:ribosome biogenesis GTPase
VVLNKCDLDAANDEAIQRELEVYRTLGYPIHRCARTDPESTPALAAGLADRTAVLVGQSGVGKSSLINRLVPGRPALEGELSASAESGRHTTTASTLYALPGGGAIIDSPGVRGFAPPLPEPRWVATGFIEIERAAPGCRFADCLHDNTAGCAVEDAAQAGLIHHRRLLSYRRLLALARSFDAERRRGGGPSRPRPVRK